MADPAPRRRWRIGIDVGGTFTDLVAVPGDGTSWSLADAITHKVPSTPHDPSEGVETGLAQPEAIALYESSGYTRIPSFGYYKDEPRNRCFAKPLGH